MRPRLTIGIAGAGGDGVITLGSLLQKLAASEGYFGQMFRYYGPQIRGGASATKLTLDAERPSLPEDVVDILLCFNWERYLELVQELPFGADTMLIYDDVPPEKISLPPRSFRIDLSQASREATGSTSSKNIVALGLLKKIFSLPQNTLKEICAQGKELVRLEEDWPALEAGERLALQFPSLTMKLAPPQDPSPKIVLCGNSAMAQAAIRAGCKAFFSYPITPAVEMMEEMEVRLNGQNGIYVQAEDEIASVGMAIGASLAGVKAMTATSGPGLDLMAEMIGLASGSEIPLVVVDVQRCGPATGIPSKSEQSDLNHAIYGGHGDAPRAVIAAYDIEGCYRLVIEGVNISEHYQAPVIVLSDQWLGQTTVAANGDFLTRDYPLVARKSPRKELGREYRRYEVTDDLISPVAFAGEEGFVYQTTGLSHDEKGVPAFDSVTHQMMHEKRWRKLLPLCQRHDLVKIVGNEKARKGIVTWGSTGQFVLETVKDLALDEEVKVCIPELIYPLPHKVATFLSSLERLLVIEMNYSGQFYRYLRSQVDLPARTEVYCRAGALPFSRRELASRISKLAR